MNNSLASVAERLGHVESQRRLPYKNVARRGNSDFGERPFTVL
jgi:hypothetical protein